MEHGLQVTDEPAPACGVVKFGTAQMDNVKVGRDFDLPCLGDLAQPCFEKGLAEFHVEIDDMGLEGDMAPESETCGDRESHVDETPGFETFGTACQLKFFGKAE